VSADPLDQWLLRAQSGDGEAVDALLDLQRADLRRLAEDQMPAGLQKRIDASDLVQQTCLSVFRSLAEFEGADPAQFQAWVRKIHERNIQNAVRDQLQAQRRALQRESSDVSTSQLADPAPSASEVVSGDEERQRLDRVLCQLAQDEQAILRLRFWDGCTMPVICERLKLTRDAATWLMHKSLRRAKKLLEQTP
jgi:RNA polymerase sigma-70 factor, ECF subfamily